jgi:cupin 2 domain-containing protein
MSSIDIHHVQKTWNERGFSFGIWSDEPGKTWENFIHATDELFLVVDGKVELEMAGRKWCPAPGEEVLIPGHTPHSVRNLGATGSRWLYGYRHVEQHV